VRKMTIAEELAKRQKKISVAEFFEKNRHLLGFDSKPKALLSAIKEAVDNSLDACEEMASEIMKKMERLKKKGKDISKLKEMLREILPNIEVRVMKASDRWEIVENPGPEERMVGEVYLKYGKIVDVVGMKLVSKSKEQILNSSRRALQYEFEADGYRIYVKREPAKEIPFYSVFLSSVKEGEKTVTKRFSLRTHVSRYRIWVEDNGPGIVKEQIPPIFGSLLYGSKFHRLKQARGQQGIGISAAVLYGQLTTGKPARITSRTNEKEPAICIEVQIDTLTNKPEIVFEGVDEHFKQKHGTRVEIELEGTYSINVAKFLKRTSIVNPHAQITLITPDGKKHVFKRTSTKFPKEPKEIKPHPHGIEMGILMRMLRTTKSRTLLSFLTSEFSRVGANSAKHILEKAKLKPNMDPRSLTREQANVLIKAMHEANLSRPPTDCLSPIGAEALKKSVYAELNPEFVVTTKREPNVYRGIPFQVEVGIAYGGNIKEGEARLLRFANKIPLMWDASACAITNAVKSMDWRRYGLNQPGGQGMPSGPIVIIVHFLSAWVPYTSEGKTAIANYPVIIREIKLALQECARELKKYLTKKYVMERKKRKMFIFLKYSDFLVDALSNLLDLRKEEVGKVIKKVLKERYGDVYEGEREVKEAS